MRLAGVCLAFACACTGDVAFEERGAGVERSELLSPPYDRGSVQIYGPHLLGTSPLDGPFTLPPLACVDKEWPNEERLTPPCEMRGYFASGGVAEIERFDSDGHVISVDEWLPDGGVIQKERDVYSEGNLVERTSLSATEQWTYVGTRVRTYSWTSGDAHNLEVTYWGPDGIDHVVIEGTYDTGVRQYRYDGGLLMSVITQYDCNRDEDLREYHSNGQLAHRHRALIPCSYCDTEWDDWFDDEGRQTRYGLSTPTGSGSGTYSWDGGLLLRLDEQGLFESGAFKRVTLDAYDDVGRLTLQRYAEDRDSYFGSPVSPVRMTTRFEYACSSSDLLREERDANDDGHIDSVHEITRDSAGHITQETFSGNYVDWRGIALKTYDYSCHE